MMKDSYKKESPLLTLTSLGGGSNSTLYAGGAKASSWYLDIDAGQGDPFGLCVVVDDSGNSFVAGKHPGGSTLYKIDTEGNLIWSRRLTGNMLLGHNSVALDSSGNVYVAGEAMWYVGGQGSANFRVITAKYNSSGNLQWQKRYTTTGNPSSEENGYGVTTDSSGNVYVSGHSTYNGQSILMLKYTSSGSLSWYKRFSISTDYGPDVDFDNSAYELLMCHLVYTHTPIQYGAWVITRFSYWSGAVSWSKMFGTGQGDGAVTNTGCNIKVKSSNYYVGCTFRGQGGGNRLAVVKFTNTGTLLWGRMIGPTGQNTYLGGVAVDNSGNVYGVGTRIDTYDLLIAKWNSSGTLQWQRTFGGSNTEYMFGRGIDVDNLGSIYISFRSNSTTGSANRSIVLKLPDDGSRTGTHGSFTYSVSSVSEYSITDASLTYPVSNQFVYPNNPTNSPSGYSNTTESYTDTNDSPTTVKSNIT
tara:strand:- start:96 stop:1505 length:1410 start_codon:yes stop_codon:yes gene_type:complete